MTLPFQPPAWLRPPEFTPQVKRRALRGFGLGLWLGAFVALTILAVNYARFGHIPGLAQRMAFGEVTIALVGGAVGYLCWIGFFLRD